MTQFGTHVAGCLHTAAEGWSCDPDCPARKKIDDAETRAALREQQLRVRWSEKERDLTIHYPAKPDGHLAYAVICAHRMFYDYQAGRHEFDPSFADELKARGYDITTLRFSIQRDPFWLAARAIGDFLQWAAEGETP